MKCIFTRTPQRFIAQQKSGQAAMELTLCLVVMTALFSIWVRASHDSQRLWQRFLSQPWFEKSQSPLLGKKPPNPIEFLLKTLILILFLQQNAFAFEILLPKNFQSKTHEADRCRLLASDLFKELRDVLPEQEILIESPPRGGLVTERPSLESPARPPLRLEAAKGLTYLLECKSNELSLQEQSTLERFHFLYQDPLHSYEMAGIIAFQHHRRMLFENSTPSQKTSLHLKNLNPNNSPVPIAEGSAPAIDLLSQIKWDELEEPQPFYRRPWFWAITAGVAAAGVGSYFIYKSLQTPALKIEFH